MIIVEVISPSSELNDTGLRWLAYRRISSLKHYIVLSQDERLVHVHSRAGDIWRERFVSAEYSSWRTRRRLSKSTTSTARPISPPDLTKGHVQPELSPCSADLLLDQPAESGRLGRRRAEPT